MNPFSPISDVLDDLRQGRMVVLVDDENRENEGDIVMAAEKVTPEAVNFMVRNACGEICQMRDDAKACALQTDLGIKQCIEGGNLKTCSYMCLFGKDGKDLTQQTQTHIYLPDNGRDDSS